MCGKKKYFQISTLQRGLEVLELLAQKNAMTITELANELGINRSTGHRFLATLEEMGYVGKTGKKRYYPTFKILQIGMQVANAVPLRKIARPYLQEIAYQFGENVNLAYWDAHQIIHLDKIESKEVFRVNPPIGSVALGHCTALGKAILAYLPGKELDSYLRGSGLNRFTEFTITQRDELDAELARIRRQGFAIDNQEFSLGLRCVAVPAFDYTGHICCSISVSALDKHMADIRIEEMQRALRRVSLVLSQKLGAPEALVETIFAPGK